MKCFYHPGVDAVGVCGYCSRGLCTASAADVGFGLVCKGIHERSMRGARRLWSLTWVFMGLAFIILGSVAFAILQNLFLTALLLPMGFLMMFPAAYQYVTRKQRTR